jgi:hypothetical protein
MVDGKDSFAPIIIIICYVFLVLRINVGKNKGKNSYDVFLVGKKENLIINTAN